MDEDKLVLKKYLPAGAVDMVYNSIRSHKLQLRISRQRHTKLGDFRPGINGRPHRISLNHDLNPYNFLIVFVHELAHLHVFNQFGNRVMPHGKEWKITFRELMKPYFEQQIFPEDIGLALKKYLHNAKAANGSDLELSRVLSLYDSHAEKGTKLETLPEGALFRIPAGRVFKKMERMRKRYKCLCLDNNRLYLFNPLATVQPLDNV
jgi:SprT protein